MFVIGVTFFWGIEMVLGMVWELFWGRGWRGCGPGICCGGIWIGLCCLDWGWGCPEWPSGETWGSSLDFFTKFARKF